MNRIDQALTLAHLGYPVFPCCANGKVPAPAHGLHDATTDPNRIAEMFDNVPDANIGLVTEGLVVIDLDHVDGEANPWAETVPDSLEPGAVTLTPRGGQHWFFRQDGHEIRNSTSLLAPGVDVRANGGYVLAPGSVVNGIRYEPLVELPPRDQLPVVPNFIEGKLIGGDSHILNVWADGPVRQASGDDPMPPSLAVVATSSSGGTVPEGHRNSNMASLSGSLRRMGARPNEIAAFLHERKRTAGVPPLPDAEVTQFARSMGRQELDRTLRVAGECRANDRSGGNRLENAAERFPLLDGAGLDALDCRLDFLIDNLLVAGQPCIVAGPKKSLKTSVMLEMAISLASGAYCFGQFAVPQPRRVLLMTGESGEGTIQETARRICDAKGLTLSNLSRLGVAFNLPRLADPMDLIRLEEVIKTGAYEVVMIDPAYLALAGLEDAGNLFAVGKVLAPLTDLGTRCGTTLVIAHHTKKNLGNPYEQPELGDIAWSGFAEWARQWVLLNRRGPFDPESGGHHELWLSSGGSAGHGGAWSLDITEGRRTDPAGRSWIVELGSARAEKAAQTQEREDQREQRKESAAEQRHERNRAKLPAVLERYPAGESRRAIREEAGVSSTVAEPIFAELLRKEVIEGVVVTKGSRPYPAVKLKQEVGQVGFRRENPICPNGISGTGTNSPIGGICPSPSPDETQASVSNPDSGAVLAHGKA